MKFYDCATAPSPRRVRLFLSEKGISLPTVQVDLRNGEQFSPAFRAINPDCTVPGDGFYAAMEAFRNSTPGLKGHALPGPDTYEQIPALAERGRARIQRFFSWLDARLADNEFVCGPHITIAGITGMVTVDFCGWTKLTAPEHLTHLRRWHSAVSARPSAKA
jgi:glutathione S-transferase